MILCGEQSLLVCRLWFVDLLYWFVDLVVEPNHLNKYAQVKLERVSPSRDEHIKYLKPPPRRFYVVKTVCCWIYRVVDLAPNQSLETIIQIIGNIHGFVS